MHRRHNIITAIINSVSIWKNWQILRGYFSDRKRTLNTPCWLTSRETYSFRRIKTIYFYSFLSKESHIHPITRYSRKKRNLSDSSLPIVSNVLILNSKKKKKKRKRREESTSNLQSISISKAIAK